MSFLTSSVSVSQMTFPNIRTNTITLIPDPSEEGGYQLFASHPPTNNSMTLSASAPKENENVFTLVSSKELDVVKQRVHKLEKMYEDLEKRMTISEFRPPNSGGLEYEKIVREEREDGIISS